MAANSKKRGILLTSLRPWILFTFHCVSPCDERWLVPNCGDASPSSTLFHFPSRQPKMLLRPHQNDGTLIHGETCGVNSPPCHGLIDMTATKSAALPANLLGAFEYSCRLFTRVLLRLHVCCVVVPQSASQLRPCWEAPGPWRQLEQVLTTVRLLVASTPRGLMPSCPNPSWSMCGKTCSEGPRCR